MDFESILLIFRNLDGLSGCYYKGPRPTDLYPIEVSWPEKSLLIVSQGSIIPNSEQSAFCLHESTSELLTIESLKENRHLK